MAAHLREPTHPLRRKLFSTAGLVTIIVFASIGIVLAAWSALGSGDGADEAVTAQTLTVTAVSSPTADLYPGGSGALQFTITNANPYSLTFTSVAYGAVTSSAPSTCPASNVTATAGGTLTSSINVIANASAVPGSISSALTMSLSAPDACQGVVFTVPVTLTGTQS